MNPLKGEAELVAGETRYTITIDNNALAMAEHAAAALPGDPPVPLATVLAGLQQVALYAVRALLWAGLYKQHRMSREAADEVLNEAGIPDAHAALVAAINGAFPKKEAVKEGGSAGPRKAAKK